MYDNVRMQYENIRIWYDYGTAMKLGIMKAWIEERGDEGASVKY